MTALRAAQELELIRKTANLIQAGHMLTASGMVCRHFNSVDSVEPFLGRLEKYLTEVQYKDFRELIIVLLE